MTPRTLAAIFCLLAAGGSQAACPRIVSQSPYLTAALDWLGVGRCIVGVSRYDTRDLPKTGGVMDPDGDVLAVLQPDLLVTSDWTTPQTLARVAPAGTRSFRLAGFGSVAEAEDMLRTLGTATEAPGAKARIDRFHRDWTRAAGQVGGRGEKVLVLSACANSPYAYGARHYIGDAFARAGFDVVDRNTRVRHLAEGKELAGIVAAVEHFRPDIVISLSRDTSAACNAELSQVKVRIVALRGENFFHPGPRLVDGYRELAAAMKP